MIEFGWLVIRIVDDSIRRPASPKVNNFTFYDQNENTQIKRKRKGEFSPSKTKKEKGKEKKGAS